MKFSVIFNNYSKFIRFILVLYRFNVVFGQYFYRCLEKKNEDFSAEVYLTNEFDSNLMWHYSWNVKI